MTEPVEYLVHDWSVLHGDSDQTPTVALLTGDGETVNLAEWTVRAQVRDSRGNLVHTFVRGAGIVVGDGEASFADDREKVPTSTLRLHLVADDFVTIPRRLARAAYDVEISRGATVRTVMGGAFEVVEDVTHG